MLAGVAGGMADYLEIDPTIVRILWIISTFVGGFTIALYVILAFVIPLEPEGITMNGTTVDGAPIEGGEAGSMPGSAADGSAGSSTGSTAGYRGYRRYERRGFGGGAWLGAALVVFGVIALANSILPGWGLHLAFGPILLVALGGLLLARSIGRTSGQR